MGGAGYKIALLVALGAVAAAPPLAARAAASACAHADAKPRSIGTRTASRAVGCLLDRRRRAHGLPALDANSDLRHAARDHSRAMDGDG